MKYQKKPIVIVPEKKYFVRSKEKSQLPQVLIISEYYL